MAEPAHPAHSGRGMETAMANYKHAGFLHINDSNDFDLQWNPGAKAPYAGIYRCTGCGHEIGIAHGHELPPQNHHQHPTSAARIAWQPVVVTANGA